LLLFFSKSSKEIGVVLSPSFSLSLKHSFFPSFVILWISELSGLELLDSVENSI
jgi:hypothetical protein